MKKKIAGPESGHTLLYKLNKCITTSFHLHLNSSQSPIARFFFKALAWTRKQLHHLSDSQLFLLLPIIHPFLHTLSSKIFRPGHLMILFHPPSFINSLDRFSFYIRSLPLKPHIRYLRWNSIIIVIFHI